MLELWWRSRRAYALGREVDALPRKATEAVLDEASATAQGFLARARRACADASHGREPHALPGGLDGDAGPARAPCSACSRRCTARARRSRERATSTHCATGSTGPMRGLTRSFGCSAAGVSASAMLGLAAVFVRRAEGTAWARAQSLRDGPAARAVAHAPPARLVPAAGPAGRGAAARGRVARAGEHAQLGQLAERWESAQRASLRRSRSRPGADRAHARRARAHRGRAGRALSESVAPLSKQVVAQTGEALTRQMGATPRGAGPRPRPRAAKRTGPAREPARGARELAQGGPDAPGHPGRRPPRSSRPSSTLKHAIVAARRERLLGELSGGSTRARERSAPRASAESSRALSALGEQLVADSQQRESALAARWSDLVERVKS